MVKKQLLRECLPPLSLRAKQWVDAKRGIVGSFQGHYRTWAQAVNASSGYQESNILDKVTEATKIIIQEKEQFERDAVVFDRPQYSYPILANLLKHASHTVPLRVLDFGGALGSSYFQMKHFAPDANVSWHVVEQPHFVQRGRHLLSTEASLDFYETLEASLAIQTPQVILLSGVLQYLEKPYELLKTCIEIDADAILIDRCPVATIKKDWLTVQKVPKNIYSASYPAWIFAKDNLIGQFAKVYPKQQEFISIDGQVNTLKGMVSYIGLSLEK